MGDVVRPNSGPESLKINIRDSDMLDLLGQGFIQEKINGKVVVKILKMQYALLMVENSSSDDMTYHKTRCWIMKNLIIVCDNDDYIDVECDPDVELILERHRWVIDFLVRMHTIVMNSDFDGENHMFFTKKLLGVLKFEVYLGKLTDSIVELTDTILSVVREEETVFH